MSKVVMIVLMALVAIFLIVISGKHRDDDNKPLGI